jgi:hypothetical protein
MSSDEEEFLPPLTATNDTRSTFHDVTNCPPFAPKLCEPRVETPLQRGRKQQRRTLYSRTQYPCALTPLLKWLEGTKAQIDCLERMLHSGMPPRVQLDNAFAGLRHSVADDIETAIEEQWKAGVKHGEYALKMRPPTSDAVKMSCTYRELENTVIGLMADKVTLERQLNACREVLSRTGAKDPTFLDEIVSVRAEEEAICATVAEQPDLCSELGAFLATLPIPDSKPLSLDMPFVHGDQIDMDALQREIDSISNLISCDA